jgi:hypothetical protein
MRSVRHGCGRPALGVAGLIDVTSSSETPVMIWSRNRQHEGQRLSRRRTAVCLGLAAGVNPDCRTNQFIWRRLGAGQGEPVRSLERSPRLRFWVSHYGSVKSILRNELNRRSAQNRPRGRRRSAIQTFAGALPQLVRSGRENSLARARSTASITGS